jgi:succinyl-diaminopimelate desuccinylase
MMGLALDKVFSFIDRQQKEMIDFQTRLTAIQALSPQNGGKGELARARWIQSWLDEHNFPPVEYINAPDPRADEQIRPNMILRVPGENRSKTIWVMAHLDTVPPGDLKLWESDPYKVIVKEGKIIGRGVEDNQQGILCPIFALRALMECKVPLAYDVGIMLVADEETGSHYGIDYVLSRKQDLVRSDDLVIVPDAGNPDGSMIEVAEKSILWCRFVIRGKQVHASTPHQGINAHRAAARLAVILDEELHRACPAKDGMFDPPGSTFEPTKHEANVENVNTIPGEETFYFDCRVLPRYSLSAVEEIIKKSMDRVEKDIGVKIEVTYPNRAEAAPPTSPDSEVVKILTRAIKMVKGVDAQPIGIGGGTVAALFRGRGIPAAVWSTLDDMAHAPNEYCKIENLLSDTKVFAAVFSGKDI